MMLFALRFSNQFQQFFPKAFRPQHQPRLNPFQSGLSLLISSCLRCSMPCSSCRRPAALSCFTPHSPSTRSTRASPPPPQKKNDCSSATARKPATRSSASPPPSSSETGADPHHQEKWAPADLRDSLHTW